MAGGGEAVGLVKGRSGLKHPALTRVFAAALAVMCLMMLLAGGMGLGKAAADRQADDEDMRRLEAGINEYTELENALAGKKTYQQQQATLDRKEDAHAENASEHRRALAEYSATRGGLVQGMAALDEAGAAFAQGKSQFEAGLKEFEAQEAAFNEGYEQYQQGVQQLEQMKLAYTASSTMLDSIEQELDKVTAMEAIPEDADQEETLEKGAEQLDGALTAYDTAMGYINGFAQQGMITPEQLAQFNAGIKATIGVSPEEARAAAQGTRDKMAAPPDETLTDEQLAQLKLEYAQSKAQLAAVAMATKTMMGAFRPQLGEMKAQLDAAQAQLDEMTPMMEQGKQGIEMGRAQLDAVKAQMEQGEKALNDGRAAIWAQQAKLKDTQAELEQEKLDLEENRANLDKDKQAAEEKLELEQQRSYLRATLLDRDGISRRTDEGMELSAAANEYLDAQRAENLRSFRGRAAAYSLMVIGAAAGFIGIPSAFEKTKKRAMLVLPPVICLVCAAAAELICLALGRGSSYSAIGVMIFAAIQSLLVLPGKKTA